MAARRDFDRRLAQRYGARPREGRLILPPGVRTGGDHPVRVRNSSGQPLLCTFPPCDRLGDDRYQTRIPHDAPRWRDPRTGDQEMLIFIFCGEACKQAWIAEQRKVQ